MRNRSSITASKAAYSGMTRIFRGESFTELQKVLSRRREEAIRAGLIKPAPAEANTVPQEA